MDTWVTQSGYPIITVTRNYDKKTAEIKQQRFFIKKQKEESKEKYMIPINFASEGQEFNDTKATHWLESDKLDITDLNVEAKKWVIFNKQQTGMSFF